MPALLQELWLSVLLAYPNLLQAAVQSFQGRVKIVREDCVDYLLHVPAVDIQACFHKAFAEVRHHSSDRSD